MIAVYWRYYRNDPDTPPWWFWFLAAGVLIGLVVWLRS